MLAVPITKKALSSSWIPAANGGGTRLSHGYGNAINALSDQEGGMAKYFSQRFAQVTNLR